MNPHPGDPTLGASTNSKTDNGDPNSIQAKSKEETPTRRTPPKIQEAQDEQAIGRRSKEDQTRLKSRGDLYSEKIARTRNRAFFERASRRRTHHAPDIRGRHHRPPRPGSGHDHPGFRQPSEAPMNHVALSPRSADASAGCVATNQCSTSSRAKLHRALQVLVDRQFNSGTDFAAIIHRQGESCAT